MQAGSELSGGLGRRDRLWFGGYRKVLDISRLRLGCDDSYGIWVFEFNALEVGPVDFLGIAELEQ